jgi:AcrR family transcriptional regulator
MLLHHRPQWSGLAKKIIADTAAIISKHGIAAATLRAVAKTAKVQPPQIYHHVGNMAQLLDAVGVYCWDKRVESQSTTDNPVNDLYDAVETLIIFGLDHPEVYLHNTLPREDRVSLGYAD